jgi:hypothetical protein
LERKQDAILPADPSPEELFEICGRFEALQLKMHKEGGQSKKLQKKADALMSEIAGQFFPLFLSLSRSLSLSVSVSLPLSFSLTLSLSLTLTLSLHLFSFSIDLSLPLLPLPLVSFLILLPLSVLCVEFVTRLAVHICAAADLQVLGDLMEGFAPASVFKTTSCPATFSARPQTYRPAPAHPDPYADLLGDAAFNADNIAPQHTALSGSSSGIGGTKSGTIKFRVEVRRNEILNDFLNRFVDLLRASDPNPNPNPAPTPGVTRMEARVRFHRKFSVAMEAALSKHLMMKQRHADPSQQPALTFKGLQPPLPASDEAPPAAPTHSHGAVYSMSYSRPTSGILRSTDHPHAQGLTHPT